MARKRTGTLTKTRDGRWQPIVTLADGTRKRLDPFPHGTEEDDARAQTIALAKEVALIGFRRRRAPVVAGEASLEAGDTTAMDAWLDRWLVTRQQRGYTSVRENASHWHIHIAPAVGHKHVGEWTSADLRALVSVLDGKVRDAVLSWKSAHNIWGTATKMARDASRSKIEALRCRDDDPSRGVEGPDRGDRAAKQFLYPSEVTKLLGCDAVPLQWRGLIALAVYTYVRAGELRVLRWEDIDLEHSTIHVHRAHDRRTGGVKGTKGAQARRFTIEPALMPLVRQMHAQRHGRELVIDMPSPRSMARSLRDWLTKAGVDRAELHEGSATRKVLTFHDLRATGLTWCAVRGDDPLRIQQRAGHTDFATTQGYIRTAEELRDGFGEPFPALPFALTSPQTYARNVRGRPRVRNRSGADGTRTGPEREIAGVLHEDTAGTTPEPGVTSRDLDGSRGAYDCVIDSIAATEPLWMDDHHGTAERVAAVAKRAHASGDTTELKRWLAFALAAVEAA